MPDHSMVDDMAALQAQACEHGRSALAEGFGSFGGGQRICAGDAWESGWI